MLPMHAQLPARGFVPKHTFYRSSYISECIAPAPLNSATTSAMQAASLTGAIDSMTVQQKNVSLAGD
jgi:hypothetical protein